MIKTVSDKIIDDKTSPEEFVDILLKNRGLDKKFLEKIMKSAGLRGCEAPPPVPRSDTPSSDSGSPLRDKESLSPHAEYVVCSTH